MTISGLSGKNKRIILGILAASVTVFILYPYIAFIQKELKVSIFRLFVFPNSVKKIGNQVNILILGIPGGSHDGPNLSDSITVFNYDFKANRAVSIGIPRDIWSSTLEDRINSAYAYGDAKRKGGGIILAKAEMSSIIGMPIQHGIVIDFNKFEDLIDYLGGVNIEIKRSFTDKKFPIEGKENDECRGDDELKCRYETAVFKKGKTDMDGKTALKYVRSRNAEGIEGSDFARSARQQQVMDAVKGRIIGEIKGLNLFRIRKLYRTLDSLIARDISNQQVAEIMKGIIFGSKFEQNSVSLERELFDVPNNGVYGGRYVLIPKSGNYEAIHVYVRCLFREESINKCGK